MGLESFKRIGKGGMFMTGNQKVLRVILVVEIAFGVVVACLVAAFIGVMATDRPGAGIFNMLLGAVLGFSIVSVPFVLLPWFSLKELWAFEAGRSLRVNSVNAVFAIFAVFLPLGLIQLFLVHKIRRQHS